MTFLFLQHFSCILIFAFSKDETVESRFLFLFYILFYFPDYIQFRPLA